jgi:hypothetical protein
MKKRLAFVLIAVAGMCLAACDPSSVQAYKPPPHIRDKQIVCALNGDSYIYIGDDNASDHTVRSPETDPLCLPLKKAAPAVGASQ